MKLKDRELVILRAIDKQAKIRQKELLETIDARADKTVLQDIEKLSDRNIIFKYKLNGNRFHELAPNENIQQNLGRGNGSYIRKCIKLASMCHRMKIKLKMNTVITNLNYKEDFSELIKIIQPRRWKIFQVLPIIGQNDGDVDELLVDSDKFQEFISKNQHLENDKLQIVPENNDAMTGSYVMIDPEGRFFSNVDGTYLYSSPILKVGILEAFDEIEFNIDKFEKRKGRYEW